MTEPNEIEHELEERTDPTVAQAEGFVIAEPRPWRRAAKNFSRNPAGMIALGFILFLTFVAIFGPRLAPYAQEDFVGNPFESPSWKFLLGTDDLGRDMLSRLIYGARASMQAGVGTVLLAMVIAVPIGLFTGYIGGALDAVTQRIMDGFLAFPTIVLALVIAAVLGPGLTNAMIAIAIILVPSFVKLLRGQTLAVSQENYVEASRSIGTPTHRIIRKRVLPGVMSVLIVQATLFVGLAIIAEAALGFIGLGVVAPKASWGSMLQRAFSVIRTHPGVLFIPGLAIALTVLAFNTFGDALRDALGLNEASRGSGIKRGKMGITTVGSPAVAATAPAALPPADDAVDEPMAVETPAVATETPMVPAAPARMDGAAPPLLSVEGLSVEFATTNGLVTVVDNVSFAVNPGEVVGLVGESGCGKSVTSLSMLRLINTPPGRITDGRILFEGRDLLTLPFKEMRAIRGAGIAMVFQDPMSSLNPAFTIGYQMVEAIRLHQNVSKKHAIDRSVDLLGMVGIPDPRGRMKEYPHKLSGGMRQRVLIAMALANDPKLLIADEPTTAVDVTVEAQILDLLKSLQKDLGMAMIFVTHDLGVVAEICDSVVVMYAGQVIEEAPVHQLFASPAHPYTRALLEAMPQSSKIHGDLKSIPGRVPSPGSWPVGCRFASRCEYVADVCTGAPVMLDPNGPERDVRCVRHAELAPAGRAEAPASSPS